MKKTVFRGVATALITPFDEHGIQYEQFGRLIDWQIESGINALVICGTTGESSTMTDEEHREAIAFAVKQAARAYPDHCRHRFQRHRLRHGLDTLCRNGRSRCRIGGDTLLQQSDPTGAH